MVQAYQDRARDVFARRGIGGMVRLWGVTTVDMVIGALKEQFDASQRWQRIGGLALIGGGLLWGLLHLPLGVAWFQVPPMAMALLVLGLASLQMRVQTRGEWAGFVIAVVGLSITVAGYMAAWIGGWRQTGMATLVGAGLQSAGLIVMGMRAHQATKVWAMMLLAGLVHGIEALWLALFMWRGDLMVSVISVLGLVIFGVMSGLGWLGIGVMVWRDSDQTEATLC
jgi:hypothetical protein